MQDDFFTRCLDWLNTHATTYRDLAGDDAPYIDRKLRHTMRVLGHVRQIINEIKPEPELAQAMEIAALLHDVGRFSQLVRQKTYDDKAYNHATAGAAILEEAGLLDSLPEDHRHTILEAVRHHNVGALPFGLTPNAQLALEVVRNADKLDAIRNNLKYLSPDAPYGKALKSGLTWDDNKVSPAVLKLALERQLIPFAEINWSNDFILFLCCWLYDLHFYYSFSMLQSSGDFDALLAKLPDNDTFIPLKTQLRDDLQWIKISSRP